MRFLVYAAGAVGSVLGGHLALRNHDVILICRDGHARAIQSQGGLRMKSATGEYFAELNAASDLDSAHALDQTCVLFTPKSNDVDRCVDVLAQHVPTDTPVLTVQNGVLAEDVVARRFERVFGGVCRMTCSHLVDGQVTFRNTGRLIIGKYPKGADRFARVLADAFADADFDVAVSKRIAADKWLKLTVNLHSGLNAIVEARDHDSPELVELKVGVLEEARQVLKKAGITAISCDGHDPSIADMLDHLRKPHVAKATSGVRVNNSTWQNLYRERDDIENGFFHAPIIEMAGNHGIDVPFNEVVLEAVTRCHNERMGPDALRAADLLDEVQRRSRNR